jgi:uncharacterized protein
MTIASDLLQRHFQTLVEDNAQWQTLIADDLVWELPYAPAIGHPARLSGRAEVVRHVTWFLEAVENFRFYDLKVMPSAIRKRQSPKSRQRRLSNLRAVSIARIMCCSSVRQATRSRSLREYFDPVRAAKALDMPILGLES